MKKILALFTILISINLQASFADAANDFFYDEAAVENQLSSIQSIENSVINHESLSTEQQEQVKKMVAPSNSDDNGGFRFVSVLAGCCCSLSGAAVASLYYYYKSGDTDKGKESLKYGMIGSVIPFIIYGVLIISNSTNTNIASILGI
jgi:hypothetical protein